MTLSAVDMALSSIVMPTNNNNLNSFIGAQPRGPEARVPFAVTTFVSLLVANVQLRARPGGSAHRITVCACITYRDFIGIEALSMRYFV